MACREGKLDLKMIGLLGSNLEANCSHVIIRSLPLATCQLDITATWDESTRRVPERCSVARWKFVVIFL